MIKKMSYDETIKREVKRIVDEVEVTDTYVRTDFIADSETDINAMNSSSEYLNYPSGSMVICLGNGKVYILNAENTEYLEFKDGGSSRTKANLSRNPANCSVSVTVSGAEVNDGINAFSIGSTAMITATANTGYTLSSLKVNGEDFTSGSTIEVDGDVVIEAVAEGTPEPSGYTWNGTDTSEKDIPDGDYLMHWVTDDCPFTAEAYIGSTITRKKLDGSDEKIYSVSAEDIQNNSEGDSTMLVIAKDEASIVYVMKNNDEAFDGLFFDKSPSGDTYWYVSSLTLAE